MYRHRPDTISFVFGLLFTIIGAFTVADVGFRLQPTLLLPALGVALGLGLITSLIAGSPRSATDTPVAASTPALEPPPSMRSNDPFFDSPIDPDLLEEAYREVFGDAEPSPELGRSVQSDSSGEATA